MPEGPTGEARSKRSSPAPGSRDAVLDDVKLILMTIIGSDYKS